MNSRSSVVGHRLLCKNHSLHKTSMMYRIVYTKLSHSLLSHCGMYWIYRDIGKTFWLGGHSLKLHIEKWAGAPLVPMPMWYTLYIIFTLGCTSSKPSSLIEYPFCGSLTYTDSVSCTYITVCNNYLVCILINKNQYPWIMHWDSKHKLSLM